jgi:hypothetical protein
MSPSTLIRETLAWFHVTFTKACACPPLDVRLEGERIECGRCGAAIEARS